MPSLLGHLVQIGMEVLKVALVSLLVIHALARGSSLPCSPQESSWVVEDPAGASALASSTNCSDGIFDVEWRGHVEFPSTLFITDGSFLNMTGADAGAVADGGGRTQFLNVADAMVHVSSLRIENCSASVGGGVFANGSLIAFNDTSFSANFADGYGGALFVSGSNVTWSGETSFVGNTAGESRSMPYSYDTWFDDFFTTSESFMFVTSSRESGSSSIGLPPRCGGALFVVDSYVSWSGKTSFSGNTANFEGGALYAFFPSVVSWSGETSYSGNTAGSQGGALGGTASNVSWRGATNFFGNTAGSHGGALVVEYESQVSWSGETSFSGNTAGMSGGALSVGPDCNVSWSGDTSFTGNAAGNSVGTLPVEDDSSLSRSDVYNVYSTSSSSSYFTTEQRNGGALYVADSEVSWSGKTTFSGNTAQSSGGAVALVGVASLRPDSVVFEGNTAQTYGGALYMTGVSIGPKFFFANFTANNSSQGGAVYSASCGVFIDPYGTEHRTTYENCTFTDNWASATGGAVESVAGFDRIDNTFFAGNSAGAGGALRLGGSTSIARCTFIDNVSSEDEGAAISNVGGLTVESNHFTGNAFWCEPGTFLDTVDATMVDVNFARYDKVCFGCGKCDTCKVEDKNLVPICTVQPEHTQSEGGDTTIETLNLDRGYWRATNKSDNILACYNEEACRGGLTGSASFCQPGYEGPCEKRTAVLVGQGQLHMPTISFSIFSYLEGLSPDTPHCCSCPCRSR